LTQVWVQNRPMSNVTSTPPETEHGIINLRPMLSSSKDEQVPYPCPVPFCTLAVAALPIRRGTTREAAAVDRLLRATGDMPAFQMHFGGLPLWS
jgi:hypothetical protein